MTTCKHADSGCNYPEGECAGVCMGMSLQDQLRNLVDCGECRTQGCIAGHCRKAKEQSMRVQAIELTETQRKFLSVKSDVKFIPGLEKPTLDETAKQLLDLYMLAAKISGSALLAGERCPSTDRESLYKIACSVLSGLGCLYFDATGQWPSICDVPNEATRSASHE